jgi:hypothetical protein
VYLSARARIIVTAQGTLTRPATAIRAMSRIANRLTSRGSSINGSRMRAPYLRAWYRPAMIDDDREISQLHLAHNKPISKLKNHHQMH